MSFRLPPIIKVAPLESTEHDLSLSKMAYMTTTDTSVSATALVTERGPIINTTDFWIDHPIRCGYLLAFCETQYSSENINFIMEIDRFRDLMSSDKESWPKPWKEIDEAIGIGLRQSNSMSAPINPLRQGPEELMLGGEEDWPSSLIARDAVVEHVYFIWNKYLSDSAPHQICMPAKVLTNTKVRLENLHIYGREVFQEALMDPLKTLKRDVLPRFLSSKIYESYQSRIALIDGHLPTAKELELTPPTESKVLYYAEDEIELNHLKTIDLTDVVCDYILYDSFLKYLRAIMSSENLLCARAIEVYRNYWVNVKKITPEIEDMAWIVFSYFVAQGSAFEVSVSHKRRKQVMQSLAAPSKQIFYRIDASVTQALKFHHENYFKSPFFINLPATILKEKKKIKKSWFAL